MVFSSLNGGAPNGMQQTFTPQLGTDIGAIEFQGNSSDTSLLTITSIAALPTDESLPTGAGSSALAVAGIVVTFNKSLDYVSANSPKNYSLIEADSGGSFTAADAITIPVTPVYQLGADTVTLLLPNGVLAAGKYQLTISGTRAIFDQSGNKLAGNGTTAGTDDVDLFDITAPSSPPVATAQTDAVSEGGSVQIVLAATGGALPLTYTVVLPPGDGTLSAITNGNTLTYTPLAGFYGADAFTFEVTDADGYESQAAVTLNVTQVRPAPVALAQSVSVFHGQSEAIVLGVADPGALASQLTYTIGTGPAHGTLTAVTGNPGAYTYTPDANYLGADSFTFTVTDAGDSLTSAAGTVTIAIVDPAPIGVPATYTTQALLPLNVPAAQGVLASDLDAAGDTLTATLKTTTAHGTLVLNANGSFLYISNGGFTGTDSFTYTPTGDTVDGITATGAPVTVTITVVSSTPTGPVVHTPPAPTAMAFTTFAPSGSEPVAHAGKHAADRHHDAKLAARHDHAKPPARHAAKRAASKPDTAGAAWAVDPLTGAMDLLAVPDPILLPGFTIPGDEVAALMLPAVPEMSRLPEALDKITKRLTQRTPSHITFVDPVTGQADGDVTGKPSGHQGWLMVDTDDAAKTSRIAWETTQA
jgi:VCBS repeat-containing protein